MSYFRRSRIVYGLIVGGALVFGHATFTGWALVLVGGGFLALLELFARRVAVTHVMANAVRELIRDNADGAQAELDRARAAKVPLAAAPLVVASVEAEIALLRGRVDEVRAIVDRSLALPPDRIDAISDAISRRELTAVGAIARATANDSEGALRAAEAIEADETSSLRALARVTIARAIVLARGSRREELGELLRERTTMLDLGASARERGLVRAFARLARAPAASVYRRNATSTAKADPGWIDAAAGDAADLLERREASAEPLAATPAEARRLPTAKTQPGRLRVLAVWTLLAMTALAVFQMLSPAPGGASDLIEPSEPSAPSEVALFAAGHADLIAAGAILLAGALLFRRIRTSMRSWDRTTQLTTAYARGAETEAMAGLQAIAKDINGALAAQASLTIATLSSLRGEASVARAAAESGLARLGREELRLATSDMLYPELVAQWAYALAAEGDAKAARGALASMPDYARAIRSRFRVELVARWREGDEAGAAAWAERGERDMSLGAEDELLADAIRAAVRGDAMAGSERARIVDEVGDPRWRRFLDGVAPGLAARVQALSIDAAEVETAAEREAAAEEEIARIGFATTRA
jgi:hypothetical protein